MRTQLPNGARLLVLENHQAPIISVRGSLRAGAYFEPKDKPGLARVTAEMLERGSHKRTKIEIAESLESVGAELSFAANAFAVHIQARSLAKDLPLMISTLAELLREPSFPPDELEKLKHQIVAEIQEQQTNTRYRAYERFSQLVYDAANPFYVPTGEQLITSVGRLTVEDVRRFYDETYGGRSLILAVVGDVSISEVQNHFARAFETFSEPRSTDINVADPQPSSSSQSESVVLKDKANVDVLLGSAVALRRTSPDYYAAMLANAALGGSTLSSRLGLQVRDKEGLTYGINSRFRLPGLAAGPWYIAVSLSPQSVDAGINSTLGVLRDYVSTGIRADELANEKSSAVGSFKVSLSTTAGLAEALWDAEFYDLGEDYIKGYPQLVHAVTAEETNETLRRYFRPDYLTTVLAGDIQS